MAVEIGQQDPWPVPHWHVHRDHWPTHGRGRVIRTFKTYGEGKRYLGQWALRCRQVYKEERGRTVFDDRNPEMEIVEFNGRTARMKICRYPLCYDGFGNERYD